MTRNRDRQNWLAKGPVRLVVATVLVIGANVALFSAFTLELPKQKVRHRTWPKVYLFPVDEPPATKVQENLLGWLDLLDPTILSLPSEKRGFSQVRRGEFVRPLVTPQEWELTVAQADLPTIEEEPLTKKSANLLDALAAMSAAAPPELPPRARYRAPEMQPGVYWTNAAGEPLRDAPVITLEEMPEGVRVSGPTRLCAVMDASHVRVKVTASCGDRRLDAQALDAMRRWLGPNPAKLPESTPIHGGLVLLAVQWRWLPGVTLVQPELDRSIWNGEDWRAFNWR